MTGGRVHPEMHAAVGRIGLHRFAEPAEWLMDEESPAEEVLDFTWLEQLEQGLGKYRETRTNLF